MAFEVVLNRENWGKLVRGKKKKLQDNSPSHRPIRQISGLRKLFQGTLHVSFQVRRCISLLCFAVGLMIWIPTLVWGIVQHPSQFQIREAVEKGQEGARTRKPPNMLYWLFGSLEDDSRPHGFLMTKLGGIAVMSSHFALRGEQLTSKEIQQILDEKALQVVVMIFGDSPTFAMDSYLLLKQGHRLIKPDRIRFDARASSKTHLQGVSKYRAKIVASFLYDAFDVEAPTTIKVFPGAGGEITFDFDFSAIP